MSEKRATFLDVDEVRRLDHFASLLACMFPTNIGIAHVGSSLTRADYRDVDVRVILGDDEHDNLGSVLNRVDLNTLLTGWGKQVTGLRIDCQVQSFSESQDQPSHLRRMRGSKVLTTLPPRRDPCECCGKPGAAFRQATDCMVCDECVVMLQEITSALYPQLPSAPDDGGPA